VSTIQSYVKIAEDHADHWDAVFIDEGHHVSTIEGQYAKALTMTAAPVKLAFTATLPYKEEAKMALEAYVGPLLAEYTIEEAGEDGWITPPEIRIIKMGIMDWHTLMDDTDLSHYKDPSEYQIAYWNGIVCNTARNMRICHEAELIVRSKKTVLINVIRREHGRELLNIINDHYGFKAQFVEGATKDRERVIKALDKGTLRCVIATKVFNEGVDIPNLNACINAAGGKSDIEVLQKIGRTLRKAEGKTKATIIDFHDTCHPILENHFFQRFRMYKKNNWVKVGKKTSKKKC
jgi:superfamily II DNA or RNA helicase